MGFLDSYGDWGVWIYLWRGEILYGLISFFILLAISFAVVIAIYNIFTAQWTNVGTMFLAFIILAVILLYPVGGAIWYHQERNEATHSK